MHLVDQLYLRYLYLSYFFIYLFFFCWRINGVWVALYFSAQV